MNLQSSVKQIVQQWLAGHEEDRARLKGTITDEWHAAHDRLLVHTYQAMRKLVSEDSREWVKHQDAVRAEVNRLCEELRRT